MVVCWLFNIVWLCLGTVSLSTLIVPTGISQCLVLLSGNSVLFQCLVLLSGNSGVCSCDHNVTVDVSAFPTRRGWSYGQVA